MLPRIARWILRLQEYDFKLEYRPGRAMQHVDALSRNACEPPAQAKVAGENASVRRIEFDDWLSTMQFQDESLKEI